MAKQFDASNPKHVKLVNKVSRATQQTFDAVLLDVMSKTAGRAWVYTVLLRARAGVSSFSSNALWMAFNEGERNVGIELLHDINRVCPTLYVEMMREANARDSRTVEYPDDIESSDKPDPYRSVAADKPEPELDFGEPAAGY